MHQKILLVYDVSYPHIEGGGQRRMYEVARRLASEGHQVSWLCFKTWAGDLDELDINGIRYIGLPGFRGLYREDGSRRRAEPLEFFIALFRSRVLLKDYDIIWSGQWPMIHLVWWLFIPNQLGGARLVVDWWEIWGRTWFRYARLVGAVGYLLEKFLLRVISKKGDLVLISPSSFSSARALAPNGNLWLINNGIDFNAISKTIIVEDERFDISYVGRLKDHKRVDLLLDAVSILSKSFNVSLSVAIIGDGPEMTRLLQQAKDLNIDNKVIFYGALPSNNEVYSILKRSRLFVNPSTKEGGGSITLFEAFAAGLPVVAFKCKDGIDPELIGDLVCGRLCETVSAESLAACIYSLIIDSELLSTLHKGALLESKKYDWEMITNKYRELFNQRVST